jgi:ribosome biogenesis GTPase / thiamine phosphate phosphatase
MVTRVRDQMAGRVLRRTRVNSIHLGWSPFFENQLASDDRSRYSVGRILEERKNCYLLLTEDGRELLASLAGKLTYEASGRGKLPSVGDWVCASVRTEEGRATIHRLLDRRTTISRKGAGSVIDEQVLAANVDTVFLVNSLNQDINPRRIERYLALVWESGARPVVLLTKADLCDDWTEALAEIQQIAAFVPVHVVSALEGRGLDAVAAYLGPGQTAVLLGSSGVGKSTLVNRILGEERQEVRETRSYDDRGRHTTTSRQLLFLPGGGMLIDTPGMRELQLWIADDGLGQTFRDVEEAAALCRFTDCGHRAGTPGCGVQAAIERGALAPDRVASWFKVGRELEFLARRRDKKAQSEWKKRWKAIALADRKRYDPEGNL